MSELLPLVYPDYLAFPRAYPDGLIVQQAAAQITDKRRVQQFAGQIKGRQMVLEILSRNLGSINIWAAAYTQVFAKSKVLVLAPLAPQVWGEMTQVFGFFPQNLGVGRPVQG